MKKKYFKIRIALIFLFLLLVIIFIGCSNKKVKEEVFFFTNQEANWKTNGSVYRSEGSSWYLDLQIFYTGNEDITNYTFTIFIPSPLSIDAFFKGGNLDLLKESNNIGARLYSSKINGSKEYNLDKLTNILESGYIEIYFETSSETKFNRIKLYENNK